MNRKLLNDIRKAMSRRSFYLQIRKKANVKQSVHVRALIVKSDYLVYFPALAKESTIKITKTPKNRYKTNSSVTFSVFSSCCSSNK